LIDKLHAKSFDVDLGSTKSGHHQGEINIKVRSTLRSSMGNSNTNAAHSC